MRSQFMRIVRTIANLLLELLDRLARPSSTILCFAGYRALLARLAEAEGEEQ